MSQGLGGQIGGSDFHGNISLGDHAKLHIGDKNHQYFIEQLQYLTIYNVPSVPRGHGLCQRLSKKLSFNESKFIYLSVHRATEGTCQWLFGTEQFISWEQRPYGHSKASVPQVLALIGKPGSGKSYTLRAAVQKFREDSLSESSSIVCLSFFFNAGGAGGDLALERSSRGLYRILLSQLCATSSTFREKQAVEILDDSNLDASNPEQWDPNILKHTILQLLNCYRDKRVLIFLDALDECHRSSSGEADDVVDVQEFMKIVLESHGNAQLCFSTRRETPFWGHLQPPQTIDVNKHNLTDIQTYVRRDLEELSMSREDKAKLAWTLSRRSCAVFLWVKCALRAIKWGSLVTLNEMMERIDRVPEELENIYKGILEGVKEQEKDLEVVTTLFQILLATAKPLSPSEVQSALIHGRSTETDDNSLSRTLVLSTSEDFRRRLHDLSHGLVEVSTSFSSHHGPFRRESPVQLETVQFIHTSVREHLRSRGMAVLEPGLGQGAETVEARSHLKVFRICLQLLDTTQARQYAASPDLELEAKHAFMSYASLLWSFHARKADSLISREFILAQELLLKPLLRCSPQAQLLLQLFRQNHDIWVYPSEEDVPSLKDLQCQQAGEHCNAETSAYACQYCMLVLLAYEGCAALVLVHAQQCRRKIRCMANHHVLERAFYFALHRGWTTTADVVWKVSRQFEVDVNVDMIHRNASPLYIACSKGNVSVIDWLLSNGADATLEMDNMPYERPFLAAVAHGHPAATELMVKRLGSNILALKDSIGRNALHLIAEFGHLPVLEKIRVDIESKDLQHLAVERIFGKTTVRIAEITLREIRRRGEEPPRRTAENLERIIGILEDFEGELELEIS